MCLMVILMVKIESSIVVVVVEVFCFIIISLSWEVVRVCGRLIRKVFVNII